MCGFISLVIQLINDLCQQQFVVFYHSKQAKGSAVMQQQDINVYFYYVMKIFIFVRHERFTCSYCEL